MIHKNTCKNTNIVPGFKILDYTAYIIMNVPILKPYISVTTKPKCIKLVPCEQPWPRVSYDCRYIPLLATKQTLPLVIEKMTSMQHEAFSKTWHYTVGPPRSPDMTLCDFSLWGYVKERVYVPLYSLTWMSSQTESRLQ